MLRVFLLCLVVAFATGTSWPWEVDEIPRRLLQPFLNWRKETLSQPLPIVGKPTEQSTTDNENYSADKAVDGSQDTQLYPNNVCTHTAEEAHPWWKVDLEEEHCISKVSILNRGDCCSDRLTNAVVRAGFNNDVITNHQCGLAVTATQAEPLGGTIEFNCDPPLRARYISVDIPTGGYLQLCEVSVEKLPLDQCPTTAIQSVQLSIVGKPTEQSTTHNEKYSSDKAVDGSQDTQLYPNNVCTHTAEEAHPWWKVDLEEEHCISKVSILNRGDCCSDRLTNAVVRAGINYDVITNHQCGSAVTATQAEPLGGTIEFYCDLPLRALYISVDIPTGGYLQLCEVTVEELPLKECPPPAVLAGQLSIVGNPTEQSTTLLDIYSSDKAVDGSQDTYLYPNNVCSHTGEEANPWWKVDLEEEHCISKVTILNRGDCCSDRLTNAVVRAGLSGNFVTNHQCGSAVTATQAEPLGGTIEFNCDSPLRAQYISVDIPTGGFLQLCEVTVEELPLDRCPAPAVHTGPLSIVGLPTEQSTTYLENYSSEKAVDGSRNTRLSPTNSCSQTGKEYAPWWRVHLNDVHIISEVAILHRGDCCSSDSLEGAVVRAGFYTLVTQNEQCGSAVTAEQAAVPSGTIEFVCDPPLRARYISVDIQSKGGQYLQMCEVTVKQILSPESSAPRTDHPVLDGVNKYIV